MKLAVAAIALLLPAAALAQTAPAPAATAAPGASAKFNLDTPIEALAADPGAKTVLDADLPGLTAHPMYESFKQMSLRQLQPFSEGKLTDEQMQKVETDLAVLK